VRVGGLAAGIHAVLHLHPDADEQAIVGAARERSVGLYGMSRWRRDGATTPPQLVLGFGNVSEQQVRRGIELVADLFRRTGP
jgi:GntR family transcriptional regulator/MocR family aminotransferase